jgi:hypothetical protein
MANINHKRGDTFQLDFTLDENGVAVDITNYDIRAQARSADGTLILEWNENQSPPGVNITNAAGGLFNLKSEAAYTSTPTGQLATESWPLGVMNVDIEFTDTSATPDSVSSSDTFTITVVEDITRD